MNSGFYLIAKDPKFTERLSYTQASASSND